MLRSAGLAAATAAGLAALTAAGGASPARAAAGWSFVSTPTDQLGVPGVFASAEITPEGGIYTGYVELAFAFGARLRPYVAPLRSLEEGGRYPILTSRQVGDGVRYTVSMLATPVDGEAVVVVRVRMVNLTAAARQAGWALAVSKSGGGGPPNALGGPRFRYPAPAGTAGNGIYAQPGEAFDPRARYGVVGGALVRARPGGGSQALVLLAGGRRRVELAPGCATRTTVCARIRYTRRLVPGGSAELEFKLPVVPVAASSPALGDIARLGYAGARAAVRRAWATALQPAVGLSVPEAGVADAYWASLVGILTSRYRLGGSGAWVQTVNDLQYHAFWLRDAALMTNALDLAGLAGPAAEDLAYFAAWQRPDGLFISRPGQYDGFGQALWALGRHAELTGDGAFARAQLPAVGRAVGWLETQLAGDRLGLLPAGDPGDDEYVAGRLAGDDFWAVAGIDAAVGLARVAGRGDLAGAWQPVAARLRASVARATRAAAAAGGGGQGVPPALDRRGGRDWGNWWVAYPDGPLAASDPIVTATIRRARSGFREGIATYAGRLHDYTGFRIFETELARGEQAAVVDGLYAELAHSTGTWGGFESDIRPGGSRSSAANLTPHGTYAAELATLIRNMLVRDDGAGGVTLLGAVPGGWLAPGRMVSVRRAPTARGRVSFVLRSRSGGASLRWTAPAGTQLSWPVPYAVSGLRASGGRLRRGVLLLPGPTGSVRVTWRLRPGGPTLAGVVGGLRRSYGG